MDKVMDLNQLLASEKLIQVCHDLEDKQWCLIDLLFSLKLSNEIRQDLLDQDEMNNLIPANIGRNTEKKLVASIRGDRILWLDEENLEFNICNKNIFIVLRNLRAFLNHQFYLNLKKFEFHYALYPPGSHYDKHIDQHKGQNQRVITFIHYLNPNWSIDYGGRLLFYDPVIPNKLLFPIDPIFGRTLLFFSDIFPHEVERSLQTRLSLTGWFRND